MHKLDLKKKINLHGLTPIYYSILRSNIQYFSPGDDFPVKYQNTTVNEIELPVQWFGLRMTCYKNRWSIAQSGDPCSGVRIIQYRNSGREFLKKFAF